MPATDARTPELARAVQAAYLAFDGYALHGDLGYCSCSVCLTLENANRMALTAPRAFTSDQFRSLASSVQVTPVELHAKALLPRALELIARGDEVSPFDNQLFLLEPFQWRAWAKAETDAIESFCAALMDAAFLWRRDGRRVIEPGALFVSLMSVEHDWATPLRRRIQGGSAEQLVAITWAFELVHGGRVRANGFLEPFPEACAELQSILMAPSTLAALERAVLADDGDPAISGWLSALHAYVDAGAPAWFEPYDFGLAYDDRA